MSQLRWRVAETAATSHGQTREISCINGTHLQATGLSGSCLTLVGADALRRAAQHNVSRTTQETLPTWIEFHDSTLTGIKQSAGAREILLDAYVHRWEWLGDQWRGTGWEQPVRMRMENAVGPSAAPELPG